MFRNAKPPVQFLNNLRCFSPVLGGFILESDKTHIGDSESLRNGPGRTASGTKNGDSET